MKIAICDDDEYYRSQCFEIAKKYAEQNKAKQITITTFANAEDLLDAVDKSGGFDLYILDIIMPGINGIELGKILRQKGFDETIIYMTTSDEFAVASYKVNAADYMIKPASDEEITAAIDKAVSAISTVKDKFVLVKTKDGSVKLSFDSIVYVELIKRSAVYHLKNGKAVESIYIRTNFSNTVKELADDSRFILSGKGMLFNMHHIAAIGAETISFDNGESVITGKKLCRDVHNAWVDYTFSEVNFT